MFLKKPAYIQKIEEIVSPVFQEDHYELIQTKLLKEPHSWVLQFLVDRPGGITVDECVKLGRELRTLLQVEDIPEIRVRDYVVEVSSPGLDRPLTSTADFEKFCGRKATLRISGSPDFHSGRKNFKGDIVGVVDEQVIILLAEGLEVKIPFRDIEEAHLVIDLPRHEKVRGKARRNIK